MARIAERPAVVLVVLSVLFGLLTVALNPPLRGPDERAHFLRAWGLAQGDIVPTDSVDGRLGVRLPARIHDDLGFFEGAHWRFRGGGYGYPALRADYRAHRAARAPPEADERAPVFIPYEGSEGYAPVAYLPHVAAALIGRALDLDFVAVLYLMRIAGLLAITAVAAWAVAVTPRLKWAFVLIAMLPSALYGRSVVGADGATLSLTLLVTALCLRAALALPGRGAVERATWMCLAVLTKPPQVVFVLLEGMTAPLRDLARRWRTTALVVLPGLLLAPLWVVAVSGEMAVWRIVEATGAPAEQFDLRWKLGFMLANPGHFPKALVVTLVAQAGDLWRQLVGVLGWLDMPLRSWVYPLVSLFVLATLTERIGLDRLGRLRLAAVSAAVILLYVLAVYLILFITWTPIDIPTIAGVQGRYFVVILPALAVLCSALVDRTPPRAVPVAAALAGTVVSGFATIEAIVRPALAAG